MTTLDLARRGSRRAPRLVLYALCIGLAAARADASPAPSACAQRVDQPVDQRGVRTTQPRVFLLDLDAVARNRTQILKRAEAALQHPLRSVMEKTSVPPSGDKHDYTSLAPYWWQDPAHPDGPWVRRDGQVNPARSTAAYDRISLSQMTEDVEVLAQASYLTGDRRFARRAAEIVRTWFLDPATAMNPNMDFAQAVPGRARGRAEGVLDGSAFERVVDAIGLLGPSKALGRDDEQQLRNWFSRYIDWMMTSANGKAERAASNNHGLWYDSQLLHYALYAERRDIAQQVVDGLPERLSLQMDPKGRMLRELSRTRSFHYSLYALEPAFNIAEMGGCLGKNLWTWQDAEGRSLHQATKFLAAFAHAPASWPYQELEWPAAELHAFLDRARRVWPDIAR